MANVQQDRFYAWADGVGRGPGHVIEAGRFVAAAVGYIESYSPPADADGEIRVYVASLEGGREHCFTVELDGGGPAPCD